MHENILVNKMEVYLVSLLIFIVIIYLLQERRPSEPFLNTEGIVVCLLCVCPNEIVINFARKMTANYKVYVVCDDIYCLTSDEPNITFLKISDEEVSKMNYTRSNVAIGKIPSAWDKALYYFCLKDTSPSHVWFIEEDVFIPRASILNEIDKKYPKADLIAKQNVSQTEDPEFGWWFDAEIHMDPPLYRSMVCASRLSRALLNEIVDFVNKKGRLVFIEILFNTIVTQKKMELVTPEELTTIIWRFDWNDGNVDENHMFHPVKNTRDQKKYREVLSTKPGSNVEAFADKKIE
jgi:hypothetical protein